MKSMISLAASSLLLTLAPSSIIAKGSGVGIYAVIEQVTFDQDGSSPNTIRIVGRFMVPAPMSSASFKAPERGYLYFRDAPGAEKAVRREWMQLRKVAGTGQVVGFAFYWVPNPGDPGGNPHRALEITVHKDGETAEPEDYPIPYPDGIVKHFDKEHFDERVMAEFQKRSN